MATTTRNAEELKEIALFVFDLFAAGTDEVAAKFNLTNGIARARCTKLEQLGIFCGDLQEEDYGVSSTGSGNRTVGKNIVWQCYETYDSIDRETAAANYDKVLGL